MDPVTVTASIAPEKISGTGRNIFVIKGERLTELPVNSLDELLRYLPGIEVQSRGPMGSQSDILLRGGTFQQVLVLIDGLRVNDPNTGHFSGYIPVAVSEIERIEILKGASSAIYGTEAVGGVIHIITKTFAAKINTNTLESKTQIGVGEYGLFTVNSGLYFAKNKTAYGIGIISNNANGQPQRGTKGSFNNHSASVSGSHFFSDKLQLSLRASYDDRNFAAQNFYTSFLSDTAEENVRTLWTQLQLKHQTEKNTLKFSLGYKDLDDHYQFNPSSVANTSTSQLFQSFLSNELVLGKTTTLTTGVQFFNKKIASNDRGYHEVKQSGIFLIAGSEPFKNFSFNPSLRAEWNELYGWDLVPQLNMAYSINKLNLRFSGGKTLRDADFTERYNNYNKSLVTSGRIGNPWLVSEQSWSYEAGMDFIAPANLKISAGYFYRDQSDLIDYILTPYNDMPRKDNLQPGGNYALAKNIASVTTSGVELDLSYQKQWNRNRMWASLGLIRMNSNSSDTIPSLYLSSHARYLANFNVQYSRNIFSLSVNGLYKDRMFQAAPSAALKEVSTNYFVLNAKLEAMVFKNMASVYVQADNLFNTSYSDLLGAIMPGRWIMGGIKISIKK